MTQDELERAACRGKPQSWWYPNPRGGNTRRKVTVEEWRRVGARAIAVCEGCPVLEPCRQEAIATNERHAVRAGLTPPELMILTGPRTRRVSDHGSHNRYSSGCRCLPCTRAHTVYMRERRAS